MMRIKAAGWLVVGMLWSLAGAAQIFEPVKWTFSFKAAEDGTGEVIAKATIEPKWHVYALSVSDDPNAIGPIPTSMKIAEAPAFFELAGGVKEGKYITHFDPNFEMDLNYFENTATFRQKVKIKSDKPFSIKGVLEYMACDDERCIFPDPINFNVQVDPKAGTEEVTAEATATTTASAPEGILTPVKWSVRPEDKGNGNYEVVYTANMDKGWHIYAQKLSGNEGPIPTSFALKAAPGVESAGPVTEGKPIRKYDPNFMMDLDFFEGTAEFRQPLRVTDGTKPTVEVSVEFMACDEERCLPPVMHYYKVNLADGTAVEFDPESGLTAAPAGPKDPLDWENFSPAAPLNNCEKKEQEQTVWWAFLEGLFWGLFALLTPCVFPMIPLTVSFFTKSAGDSNGKSKAVLYGLFILLVYVSVSIPFHIFSSTNPEVFNEFATNAWVNLVFFAIFIFFAISFFGYYEITLPSGLANKVDNASNIGGILGVFFMALTLVVVSFSCTGPILGGMLGQIYAAGNQGTVNVLGMELGLAPTKLSAATAGFGLALGGPFGVFAFFPSLMKKLPKSGGWLEDFKVSLGFLELALAVKFISNADLVQQWGLVKRELFFAIWIIIGLFWAMYLFGWFRFKPGQGSKKRSAVKLGFAILIGAFTLRLLPGLLPANDFNKFAFLSGFPPPQSYSYYEYEAEFKIYHDLAEAIEVSKQEGKPIFVDFTGWACVNCRKMEETVWPEDEIKSLLAEEFIMVSLYVDEKVELPADQQFVYTTRDGRTKQIRTVGNRWATLQTETFENNSQPFYAILAPDSTLLAPTEQYNPKVDEYAKWLRCGLDAHDQWRATAQNR